MMRARAIFPRWLIVPLLMIFVVGYAATTSLSRRDPVTGELLNLPIDRTAVLLTGAIAGFLMGDGFETIFERDCLLCS